MKEIQLTQGYFTQVDDDDFEWLSQWGWNANVNRGRVYAVRNIRDEGGKYVTIYMHRQIMGVSDRLVLVDHHRGNGLNNTRENLRVCTYKQNLMNRGGVPNTTSRFKGVSWDKVYKKWVASISINGKRTHFGRHDNEEDCARVFNQQAKKYHGEFAQYNDVTPMFPDKEWTPTVVTSKNTSGFRGVFFERRAQKWIATVQCNGKCFHIGTFSDPLEAAKAYDAKSKELFGASALLNF